MSFRHISLAMCLALTLAPTMLVLAAEPARILITDVTLINRQEGAEDVVADLLITDGQLEVITKDDIETEAADLVVDGKGGFLLGKLEIGTSPNFVILDKDPREEIEVLLDTKAHIQFAVKGGEIVVNNLPQIAVQPAELNKRKEHSGWLAYEPPPLALPLSYQTGKKWNRFESKYVNGLATGALAVDRTRWLSQDESSTGQVGDLSEFDGGEIRALRFGLAGTLNFETPWVYVIAGATNGFTKGFDTNADDDFTMFDYRLDIPVLTNTTLSIGKQKEPISLERLTGMVYLPWQERTAASDALFPSRNHGIVINGMRSDGWMTWAAGAFNNWIDSDESFEDTASQLVGRLSWVPLVSDDESSLVHLGFGLRHTDAKQGIRYRTAPEISQAPDFADTGSLSANDALTYNLEAYWRKGPGWFGGEYIRSDIDSPEFSNPSFDGYHLSASWAITGEMRTYRKRSGLFNPLPVARPTSAGGWGAWEAAYRYSSLNLSDGLVDGGELNIHSVGVNWWLTHVTQFSLNYRRTTLNQDGTEGDNSAVVGRLVLILD
jgi:phosphate-selective porin OprO/OprP